MGLTREDAHSVVNEYNRRARSEEELQAGQVVHGLLQGVDCLLREVDKVYFANYLGWNRWLYNGNEFLTLQLIWPTTTGIWPWQPEASDGLRKRRPILAPPIN